MAKPDTPKFDKPGPKVPVTDDSEFTMGEVVDSNKETVTVSFKRKKGSMLSTEVNNSHKSIRITSAMKPTQGYGIFEAESPIRPGNIVALMGGGDDSTATLINVLQRMSKYSDRYDENDDLSECEGLGVHLMYFDFGQSEEIKALEILAIEGLIDFLDKDTQQKMFRGLMLDLNRNIIKVDMPKPPAIELKAHGLSASKNMEGGTTTNVTVHVVNHRNNQMVMTAAAFAEDLSIAADYILLGTTLSTYSADCWPVAAIAMQDCILACSTRETPPRLVAPYVYSDKTLPVKHLMDFSDACIEKVNSPLPTTFSCYAPVESGAELLSCGTCLSCQARLAVHKKLGVRDNIKYVDERVKDTRRCSRIR